MTDAPAHRGAEPARLQRQTIFEADGVVKRFGGIRAVDGATLERRATARSPP